VWFEDLLHPATLDAAVNAMHTCDLLVSVGTSGVVYPAAALPEIASARGATTVEINLEDTPASALYQYRLRGKASELLRSLWQQP
jgi:NAD-dependent deacetylase